ncbi:MAG: calcium/sodium antiporter [Erysipelotrichaceae bacterium]|nr:calcium/sodium antiporter [Erysipelotrichaceae bacterium]
MFLEVLDGLGYFLNILFLVIGVVLLVKGADFFVGGASSLAKKFRIPVIVIGLTVVSFGTSAPELAVSLTSSIKGNSGIALGNVVGSNIMNLLVVLGCSSVIAPIAVKKSICKREFPFLIGATILLMIFSMDALFAGFNGTENFLSRGEALIFVIGIVAFCYISIVMANKEAVIEAEKSVSAVITDDTEEAAQSSQEDEIKEIPLWQTLLYLVLGLAGIIVGAEFVTTPATSIAVSLGEAANLNSEMVINVVGLTVVAIGTSLPELVTSIMAAKRGENEIAIGNVVGSNIFNILFICGLSGLVTPLTMTSDIITDMVLSLGATILVFCICRKGKISRKNGAILLGVYAIYLTYILIRLVYPFIAIPF